tara:strand:- start:291 stop:515 length:225 start_codon:yes stop_codon:yes gene_type:complete
MAFKENKLFNSLTPGDIYTVSRDIKDLLNKILKGNLSSVAFVRENEDGDFEIKPATHSDKSILLEILNYINSKK